MHIGTGTGIIKLQQNEQMTKWDVFLRHSVFIINAEIT